MNLNEIVEQYWRRTVCVKLEDGKIFRGKLVNYTSEADNEPEPESITIDTVGGMLVELFVNEIEEVKLI